MSSSLWLKTSSFKLTYDYFLLLQDTGRGPALDTFWIFPYYMEPQIIKYGFHMSDYQVTYSQEGRYRQGHKTACRRKLGSPVRIFTTLQLKCIDLSHLEDNYRLCQTCDKHVAITNR